MLDGLRMDFYPQFNSFHDGEKRQKFASKKEEGAITVDLFFDTFPNI